MSAQLRIGSINRLVGGSQRLISPDRPGRPKYLPPADHAGSSISGQIRVSEPNSSRRRPRRRAFPLPPVFPTNRRHGRATDGIARMRSSWGLSAFVKQSPLRRPLAQRLPQGLGFRRFRIQVSKDQQSGLVHPCRSRSRLRRRCLFDESVSLRIRWKQGACLYARGGEAALRTIASC